MSYKYDKRKNSRKDSASAGKQKQRRQTSLPNSLVMRIMEDKQAENEAEKLSQDVTSSTPDSLREEMGSRLGADFSNVQFHSDSTSISQSRAMGARAWAQGSDVYFGMGGFDPKVAAHELVHTVQQGAVRGDTAQSAPYGAVQLFKDEDENKIYRREVSANTGNLELMVEQKNSSAFGPRVFSDLKKPVKKLAEKSGNRIRTVNEDSGISFLANLGERDYSGKEILRDIAARTVINKDEMNDRIDEYEGFLDYMQNRTNKVGLEAASMQAGILNGPPKYVNENDQFINKRAYEMNAEELANNGFNPDNDAEIRTVLEKINNAQNEKEAFHAFLEYTENREFTRREYERSQRVVNIAEQAIPSVKNSGGIFKRVDPLVAGAFQERNAKLDTDITNAYNRMMEAQQKGKDLPPGQEREELKAAFNAAKEDYKKAKDKKQKDAREVKFDYQRGAEVNVPLLKEKLKNMVRQVRDYPELKHKIGSLNIMWNTPVGSRKAKTDNETMSVNTYAGGSEKATINYDAYLDRDSKEAQQERDFYNKQREESGSSNLGRSGNHELGHVLESTLNTELTDHKKNQASNDILQSVLPKVMTQDELNEVKYNENNGKNQFDSRIYKGQIDTQSEVFKRKKMTSVYGQSKPSEWLAEAFQDVYTRGAAAKPTSIEIVKEYERRQTEQQKGNFQKKKRGWFTNIMRGISRWFGFGTVHADQRMNPSNDLQSPAIPNVAPMPEIPDPGPAVQGPQLIEDNDVPGAVNKNHYEDNFLDKAMLADIKKKGKKRKKKK